MKRSRNTVIVTAALAASIATMVLAATGLAGAAGSRAGPRAGTVVRLGPGGRIPVALLPTVPHARNSDRVGGQTANQLAGSCLPTTVDLGTWCLMAGPYPLTNDQLGKNNYFFATQACVAMGGYLPTAAQLIGAAPRVRLESTIDDSKLSATVQQDPSVGLKDQREMSATLVTTAAGPSAAGSEGVTVGSTGNPKIGEPNPTPFPANPQPQTLQYVTVYDNHDQGGFAGSEPVSKPESFRCAFDKALGASGRTNG